MQSIACVLAALLLPFLADMEPFLYRVAESQTEVLAVLAPCTSDTDVLYLVHAGELNSNMQTALDVPTPNLVRLSNPFRFDEVQV